jgi:hypothetical protein
VRKAGQLGALSDSHRPIAFALANGFWYLPLWQLGGMVTTIAASLPVNKYEKPRLEAVMAVLLLW